MEAYRPINIAAFGEISLIIDETNLQLEKVSLESLQTAFDKQKTKWETIVSQHELQIDPFVLFGLYQIQRKVISVLGVSTTDTSHRNKRLMDLDHKANLSQMKDIGMCSELASLAVFIAHKIGWKAKLVIGSVITGEDQWREAHAFAWIDDIPAILDLTAVKDSGELPPLFIADDGATWSDFENGKDIQATRIGTDHTEIFGVEAGGFGIRTGENDSTPTDFQSA